MSYLIQLKLKTIKELPVLSPLDNFAIEGLYQDHQVYETVEGLLPQLKDDTVKMINVLRYARHYLKCGRAEDAEIAVSDFAVKLNECGLPIKLSQLIESIYTEAFPEADWITMPLLEDSELAIIQKDILSETGY